MNFSSEEDNKRYKNNILLDRIVNLINYLIDRGYYVEFGSGWGEPLLIFNQIKYIFDHIERRDNINFELLSSFAFDSKNNYKSVFTQLDKYQDLFEYYKIPYSVRWSIHTEYLSTNEQIHSHYQLLNSKINSKFIPMIMMNTKKNIWQFKFLKNKINNLEYHLILDNEGNCPLLADLTDLELNILKSMPYFVRGAHIVDRIRNKNFSFTGTLCHLDNLIAIMPSGRVVKCINDIYQFPQKNFRDSNVKLLTEVSNEYVENLGISNSLCKHKECNICATDPVDVYDT
jgi:hypothetical protein